MKNTPARIVLTVLTTLLSVLAGANLRAVAASNLILVTVDTLRADHLSHYNPDSPARTPHIDSLAAEGVTFLNAQTTNPLTTPAHASLLTGLWPQEHGVRDFTGYRLGDQHVTLAEVLSAAGYQTGAFVTAAVLDRRTGISQGFTLYDDGFQTFIGRDSRVAQRPGTEAIDGAQVWLSARDERPFFLWVHLFEPHDPYEPPETYASQYPGRPYAGEVAYADALVGRLLDVLKDRQVYDNSVIVVLSDHGEGLGDHGESKHGFFVYQSTIHIPWVMRLPRAQEAGRKVRDLVSIIDVFPTLLHLLEVDREFWPEELHGRSRYGLIRGRETRQEPVYAESQTPRNQFGWSGLSAIFQGRLKYIEAPRPELYDLNKDPRELDNLYEGQRAMALGLRESLRALEARLGEPPPDAEVQVDPELQERLRSLGYVGVQGPRKPGTVDGADPKDKIQVYEQMQKGVEAARNRNWEAALRELKAAAAAEPRSPSILTSLALTCRDAGQTAEALDWFRKAVDVSPSDAPFRLEFVQLLLAQRRIEEARTELEAILELDPANFLALFNLGTLMAQKSDFEMASRYFSSALEVKREAGVLRSLALALTYLHREREAEEHLLAALEMEPGDRRTHLQLADLYTRLGQPEKARRHRAMAQ